MKFKTIRNGLAGLLVSSALFTSGCEELGAKFPYATVRVLENGCVKTETVDDLNKDGKADTYYITSVCGGQIYTDVVSNLDLKKKG